jgi:hypothetical protein
MKSAILASAALALGTITLSGCGGQSADQTEAAPEGFPGITVSNARLVLPAVKGNPGAVYFDVAYKGDDTAVIRAAAVEGAKSAMMHEYSDWNGETVMGEMIPTPIKSGSTMKFEPGGRHVMAMELDDSLVPGGTTEVTLTFLGGDKFSFPAEILAAGDER